MFSTTPSERVIYGIWLNVHLHFYDILTFSLFFRSKHRLFFTKIMAEWLEWMGRENTGMPIDIASSSSSSGCSTDGIVFFIDAIGHCQADEMPLLVF